MRNKWNQALYKAGKIICFPFILFILWFSKTGFSMYGEKLFCFFKRYSGISCPGCGGTRALYLLGKGDITGSFFHHPAVVYMAAVYLYFMLRMFFVKHIKGVSLKPIRLERYAYILIAVILAQWVVKIL